MALRKIARLGEPILRTTAARVSENLFGSAGLERLLTDMLETMRDAGGAGLAAPQIYEPSQVCLIEVAKNARYPDFPDIPLTVLINPVITPIVTTHDVLVESEAITMYEGCLSVPGLRGRVTRPAAVRVRAQRPDGTVIDETWSGVAAAIVQHEVEHLHGVLFVDRADASSLCFEKEYKRHVPHDARIILGDGSTSSSRDAASNRGAVKARDFA